MKKKILFILISLFFISFIFVGDVEARQANYKFASPGATTNKTAFNANTTDLTDPPAFSMGGGTNASNTCYVNLGDSNDVDCPTRADGVNQEPFLRMNFTIDEAKSSINWIAVYLEQAAVSNGEVCENWIANYTQTAWFKFDPDTGATETTAFENFTTNAVAIKFIDAERNLTIMSVGRSMDNNEGCDIDFVNVTVDFSLTTTTNVNQSLTMTPNTANLFSFDRRLTNTFSLTDVRTPQQSLTKSLTNAITATMPSEKSYKTEKSSAASFSTREALGSLLTRVRLPTNAIDLTELTTRLASFTRSLTNALDLTEAITRLASFTRSLTNSIDLTEAITRLASFTRSITNAFNLTELAQRFRTLPRAVTQALDITDKIQTLFTRVRLLTNAIDLTEAITRLASFTRSITNALDLTNAITKITSFTRSLTNSISLTDRIITFAFRSFTRTITEALDITDKIQNLFTRVRLLTNAIDLTEAITRLASFTRSITNVLDISELTQRFRIVLRQLNNAMDITDTIQRTRGFTRIVSMPLGFAINLFERFIDVEIIERIVQVITGGVSPAPSPVAGFVTKSFDVDKDDVKVVLLPGEIDIQFISINNTGDIDLQVKISTEVIGDFITISQKEFILKKGESKSITVKFSIDEKTVPDVYTGKILIKGDSLKKEVDIVIEVESPKPLFDIKITVPQQFKTIVPGGSFIAEFTIFNLGKGGRVDVNVELGVKDTSGNIIVSKFELVAVETQISFTREFQLPEYIKDGTYVVFAKVTYDGEVGTATDTIEVVYPKPKIPKINFIIIFAILGVTVILVGYYWYEKVHTERKWMKLIGKWKWEKLKEKWLKKGGQYKKLNEREKIRKSILGKS